MNDSRPASLEEREAFLLTLFGKPKEYHGSYITEKVQFALNPWTTCDSLESALDSDNQETFRVLLARRGT